MSISLDVDKLIEDYWNNNVLDKYVYIQFRVFQVRVLHIRVQAQSKAQVDQSFSMLKQPLQKHPVL